MAMTSEGKVKAKLRRKLDSIGCYYFSPQSGIYGAAGMFDIVALVNGQFIGIEVKKDCLTAPTGLQSRNAKRALACGAVVLLIHDNNVDQLPAIIQEILDATEKDKSRFKRLSIWPFDGVTL